MKKLLMILLVSFAVNVAAQTDYVEVLANNNSEVFKIAWMPKNWPDSLVGFELKYSNNESNWDVLSDNIFVPEIKKDIKSVFVFGNNEAIETNKNIIAELLDNGQLKEQTRADFKNNILPNDKEIQSLGFLFAFELSAFMYAGFGLMDYEKRFPENYYYGLFPVFTNSKGNEAIYTYYFEHNKELTYDTKFNAELSLKGKNTLVVTWAFDGMQFKKDRLKGVNLFKEENSELVKLNDEVVVITNKSNIANVSREFKIKELSQEVNFLIEPVSYLNFVGKVSSIKFNKDHIVSDVDAPTIDMVNSGINSEGTGIELVWEFSQEGKESFEYLMIERKEKNEEFKIIDSVTANLETYTDFPQKDSLYYYYRITAKPKIGNKLISNTYLGFFKKNPKPNKPDKLEGNFNPDDERKIVLNWQPNDDGITTGYQIYSGNNPDELARESSIGIVTESNYAVKVYRTRSKSYYFAVSAINSQSKESELSNIVEVIVPSESIPPLNVWPIAKENNQVILNWQYPEDISDLDVFNIYKDGELLESLSTDIRTWRSDDLDEGKYDYQVEAVTRTGVSSGLSKIRTFIIE